MKTTTNLTRAQVTDLANPHCFAVLADARRVASDEDAARTMAADILLGVDATTEDGDEEILAGVLQEVAANVVREAASLETAS